MIQDREAMSASLIEVILIANLAYAKAMEFSEVVKRCTGEPEGALAEDVKRIVKVCEEVALSVDEAGTDKQVKAFSDIIDETEEDYNAVVEPLVPLIRTGICAGLFAQRLLLRLLHILHSALNRAGLPVVSPGFGRCHREVRMSQIIKICHNIYCLITLLKKMLYQCKFPFHYYFF